MVANTHTDIFLCESYSYPMVKMLYSMDEL